MSEKNFSYYQFRKELGYQVYLRFEDFDFETQLADTLEVMGFNKVERKDVKNLGVDRRKTKVLKVVKASPRVAKQIDTTDYMFEKYGPESLSAVGNYQVYRYKNVGMMIFGEKNFLWELGLKNVHQTDALRNVLTRFLSFALASQGVVGFWGVPVEEGFVVMSPKAANYESVFIDLKQNVLITYDGLKSIESSLQILRLDSTLNNEMKMMTRERLLSFLSTNTAYFSYSGFELGIKDTIYDLSQIASGIIYPETNFKPRADHQEAA